MIHLNLQMDKDTGHLAFEWIKHNMTHDKQLIKV